MTSSRGGHGHAGEGTGVGGVRGVGEGRAPLDRAVGREDGDSTVEGGAVGGVDAGGAGVGEDGTTARLTVQLTELALLRVTVTGSGRCTVPWTPGVGIQSMHERVEEFEGTLTVDTTPEGATVTADLPLVIPVAETPWS
ncbi:hypothetical protein OHU34_46115 (plasmid) [Streptomyces sp. NBC_00080]|uniref:hypothetical protein n=1 Tax=Streptomyces sp. NBC_00080 TaxID=2975645 RepID=UPI002F90BA5B